MSGSLPCFSHISASHDVGPLRIILLIFLCRSINTLMPSNLINTLMPSNLMTLISDSSHCGRYPVPLGKGRGPATLLSLRTRPVGSFQRWYTVCGMPIQCNRNLVRMPLVLEYCFAIILVKQKPFFKLAQCS